MDLEIEKRNFFKKYNTLETLKYVSLTNNTNYINKLKNSNRIETRLKDEHFLNIRLAFNVIKYSSDFRGIRELDRKEISKICKKIINDFSYTPSPNLSQEEFILEITTGHSQEQFFGQEIFYFLPQTIARNKKILSFYNLPVSINEILSKELNIDMTSSIFEKGLEILWYLFINKNIYFEPDLNKSILEIIEKKKLIIKLEQVKAILSYYTCDYEWIKTKNEKDRPFFIKPIIKTKNYNRYIMIDIFSFSSKFADGIYWIIRNYYNKITNNEVERQRFVSEFGNMFEKYIEELLLFLLAKENFKKLNPYENKKTKSLADWIIETKNYNLIVEQKSTLLLSSCKTMEINIKGLKKGFLPTLKKAFKQLQNTEKDKIINNKKTIKLILLYEYFPTLEALKAYFENILKDKIDDLQNYIFISTDDFEILMTLLKNDENLFDKVIEERLELEKELFKGAKFSDIFDKYSFRKNEYIEYLIKKFKNS